MAFKAGAIYGEAVLDTKKWNTGLSSLTKGVGIAAAAIGAAFVGAMTVSIKAANEFQKAMSNVATLVDTNVVNMQALAKQVLTLSPELGDATELTKGLYQAFSAGATTAEEAMKTTTDAAKFAKAALTDTFTAVDILTTAVNAYGRETMSTTKASDIFFQTIKLGKTTGEQLAASIGNSIPIYASAGIKLEELASGIAAMTKQGINAAESTTALNAIVNAFLKPSVAMEEALERIGYESGSAFLKTEGLAGALKFLEETTQGDAAAMSELLPNIRALKGAMALTGVGGEEFARTLEAMATAAGSTEEAFAKQEKTFETFKNSLNNLKIVVGNIGKAFIDDIVVGATNATQSIMMFLMSSRGMEIVARIVGTLAGAFTLVKEIVTPLFQIWKESIATVWDRLRDAVERVTGGTMDGAGAFKLIAASVNLSIIGFTVLTNVLVTVIDLIADLIIGIRESSQTIGTFFQFLTGKAKWEDVKENAASAGEAFENLGKRFAGNVTQLFTDAYNQVSAFGKDTEDLATDLQVKVTTSFTRASEGVRENWGELTTGQAEMTDAMLAELERLRQGMEQQSEEQQEDEQESVGTTQDTWAEKLEIITSGTDAAMELYDLQTEAFTAMEEERRAIAEEAAQKEKEELEERQEQWREFYRSVKRGLNDLVSGLRSIWDQYYENQRAQQDLAYQEELTALDQRLADGLITQEQYEIEKAALDKKAADEANALAEKQFKTKKAFDIVNVWMDAASSIAGWWRVAPTLGPIAGPIFAGVMTGLTVAMAIAQSALIARQQFVPAMAEGGTASGLTRINERGGEILNLPDGTMVIPNDISREIARAGGSSSPVYNISFDGARISDEMDLDRVTDVVIKKLGRELRLTR